MEQSVAHGKPPSKQVPYLSFRIAFEKKAILKVRYSVPVYWGTLTTLMTFRLLLALYGLHFKHCRTSLSK